MKNYTQRGYWTLLCGMLALLAAPGAGAQPVIMSPEPVHNFGEVENSEKVTHGFLVKNAGDEPLSITDVKTSCGCTVADLETDTLAPGQETTITAIFDLKGRQGLERKRITVVSNDPEQPTYALELMGTALATIEVDPTIINLGRIEDTESHRKSVTLRSTREGHSFNVEEVQLSDNSAFQTELETVTPGKEYKVTVVTNPNQMPGTISGRMTIRTDDPGRPAIPINVYGHVIGALQVRPDVITIQANSAEDARPASMFLQVLPGRVKEFELVEILAPVDDMTAELIERKPNDYHIKLTGMPVDQTLKGKELIVQTNLPEMPELRIPFRIRPERRAGAGRAPARVPASQRGITARPPQPVTGAGQQ